MTPDDAFLQAILDDPEDDTPRLIYADWLEERGDPRGEFVRVQVELARDFPTTKPKALGSEQRYDRWRHLVKREHELLLRHWLDWMGFPAGWLLGLTTPFHERIDFRRGFVEEIQLSTAAFLEHAQALFGVAPIRAVGLSDRTAARAYDGDRFWVPKAKPPFDGNTHRLPQQIFDRITGRLIHGHHVVYYRTEADALAALSQACVEYGRSLHRQVAQA